MRVLAAHNLRLHEDGTRIVDFDKGFDFIGYLFLKTLALKEKNEEAKPVGKPIKSEVTDEGVIELEENGSRFDPGKRVLYVIDPNHTLGLRNRSFSVRREDGSELIAIPHHRIGRIEVGPIVGVDRAPFDLALETSVDMAFVDGLGQTTGLLASDRSRRAALQLAQAHGVFEDAFRIEVARRLVDARIRNQRTQLMRLDRARSLPAASAALQSMMRLLRKTIAATSVDELRGLEGAATAAYWPAFGAMIDGMEGDFRRSRPAADPVNAVINYLTGILERDTRAAIQSVGLHPGFGFLHAAKDGHEGLVYDLMEPFRAGLTEGIVAHLFNARRLRPDMFDVVSEPPTRMHDEARRAVIRGYEAAVAKRINRTDGGGKLGWRAMMRHQAATLARAVERRDVTLFIPHLMEA